MNKAAHSPQLRFPEFDGKWEEKKLGDIGSFKGGGTPSKSVDEYWEGDIPWISSSDISEQDIHNIKISRFINEISIKESATKIIPKESVLFVSRVGVGKLAINKKEICTSQDFTSLLPKNNSSYFLGYFFLAKNNLLIRYSQGTSIKGFTKNDIETLKLNVPTKPEQTKIAAFLTAVDTKIEQLSKKQELLGEYKKGVMQQIFSQVIRFKADDGCDFPDWKERKLEGVGRIRKGSQLNKSELTDTGDYPAINGGINPSGYTDKWNTGKNTITISEGGNSCGYINFITSKFWSGGHCYSIEELKGDVLNRFLFQYLKFNEHLIMRLRVGSGLPNIQKGEINNFKVNLPSLEEQTKIANLLSSIDNKIEQVGEQLRESKQFKKALLQQMFV